MKADINRQIRDWLAAEGAGADERADEALAAAIRRLAKPGPAPGLSSRVLAAAGFRHQKTRIWHSRAVRAAVLATLLVVGCAATAIPSLLALAEPVGRVFGWPLVSSVWHWAGRWIDLAFASWTVIESVGHALRASLSSPTAASLLLLNVLIAAVSLLGLRRLLAAPEESLPC